MKNALKAAALITSIAAFGLIAGCGDDNPSTPTGKVVKAPVKGAKITFAGFANYSTKTDANGNFLRPSAGAITSTGGTYVDVVTKATVAAPTLKAPAGSSNVTALTTLVALDTTGAVKAKIEALGIKFDDAITTVTAANQAACALNESIGSILQTAGNANINAVAANLITVINGLTTAQMAAVATTPSTLTAVILTPALTAAQTAGTITAAQAATITTSVTATVAAIKPGVVISGATGGTSAGTGTGQ